MRVTTAEQATEWLVNQINYVARGDMNKMKMALEYVGNPHLNLPVIHITGTNGKGSTVSYMKNMLMSQGLKVATFTSPHIEKFNERITYDGQMIPDEDLIRLTNVLIDLNDYMQDSDYGILIYFELFTIMMALYFQEKQPDICLIEAGIGGLNDCTNILDSELAVITSVALDHGDLLGDTKEAVALEKAGIVKKPMPLVTGWIEDSPLAVIEEWAKEKEATHYRYDKEYQVSEEVSLAEKGQSFTFSSPEFLDEALKLKISMLGEHQTHNAAVAVQSFIVWMQDRGLSIDWPKALKALDQTSWIGRLEKIHDQPAVYVDGAHNMEGLTALEKVVSESFADYEVTVIYAGLKKKNQEEQLPLILNFDAKNVKFTTFKHFETMEEEDFTHIVQALPQEQQDKSEFIADWSTWIGSYLSENAGKENQLLLVTGSLYFVSQVREYLKK